MIGASTWYIMCNNSVVCGFCHLNQEKYKYHKITFQMLCGVNYINPGYGLSLVDTLWNGSSYRQPLEQEGNPMT